MKFLNFEVTVTSLVHLFDLRNFVKVELTYSKIIKICISSEKVTLKKGR